MAKGKTIEINGNALVDAGRLQAAALSQIEQVLAKRSLQVLRAAKDGLREYLLGDPGRKPHRFKYPISIKRKSRSSCSWTCSRPRLRRRRMWMPRRGLHRTLR